MGGPSTTNTTNTIWSIGETIADIKRLRKTILRIVN